MDYIKRSVGRFMASHSCCQGLAKVAGFLHEVHAYLKRHLTVAERDPAD